MNKLLLLITSLLLMSGCTVRTYPSSSFDGASCGTCSAPQAEVRYEYVERPQVQRVEHRTVHVERRATQRRTDRMHTERRKAVVHKERLVCGKKAHPAHPSHPQHPTHPTQSARDQKKEKRQPTHRQPAPSRGAAKRGKRLAN
jgi:hypothetical protein